MNYLELSIEKTRLTTEEVEILMASYWMPALKVSEKMGIL
jgi:hypothetical protein